MENLRGKAFDNFVKTNPYLAYLTSVENMQIVLGKDCQKYINIALYLERKKELFSLTTFYKHYDDLALEESNIVNNFVMNKLRNNYPEEFNFLVSCMRKLYSSETMASIVKVYDDSCTAVSKKQPSMEQKDNDKSIGD